MTSNLTRSVSVVPGRLLAIALVILTLAVGACSSAGSTSSPSAPASAGPSAAPSSVAASASAAGPSGSLNASAEIDAVIKGLNDALALYKDGKTQQAMDEIAETYEDHFELIEDPLEDRNDALKEELEETIASDIRAAMQAGKPAAEVEAMIGVAIAKLETARGLLA